FRDRIPKGRENAATTRDIPLFPNRPAPLVAGDILNAYPTQIAYGWGVGFNVLASDFWVSNLAVVGGDDHDYRYLTDGTLTGDTIDDSSWVGVFVGDGTFNARTGKLWWVNVGGDNCLYEDDPISKAPTGNKICGSPWTNTSQRGLAYDVQTDTYFVGGWNEGVIYHIDGSGTVLDSAFVGLSISGLAFNSVSGHLFVMTNDAGPTNVYVLDATNNYALLSSFAIPGFAAYGGAGFEAACNGHLWLVDQQTQTIYEVDSGELGAWCALDIPWLSENPTGGLVTAGNTNFPVTATFDGTATAPGLYQAQLQFTTNTPYAVPALGVDLTVRFLDVPDGSFAENFIYGLAGAGIAAGCGGNNYCPNASVTRAQMAVFVEKGKNGTNYVPPACIPSGIFEDVICPYSFAVDFIEAAFYDGIVVGCSAGHATPARPFYCPDDNVTRAQMAVFIERAVHGPGFVPPPATGIFADVPPGSFAADYVEALYNDGIAAGCGGGNYCPNDPVTRAQMAVFIVTAFNVPHL
ncbi:MAG: S-layer homology domain-containing protein, partial [Thermoanaerobaculia bacterium]